MRTRSYPTLWVQAPERGDFEPLGFWLEDSMTSGSRLCGLSCEVGLKKHVFIAQSTSPADGKTHAS